MIFDRMDERPGARLLLVLACLVIIVAGLKAASPILVPFVLALFLAVVSMPIMFGLRRIGLWAPLAISATILLNLLVFGLMILMGTGALGDLRLKLPRYLSLFRGMWGRWLLELDERGIPASTYLTLDPVDPARVLGLVGSAVQAIAQILGVSFIIGLIMFFILAEATVFPVKFQAILGGNRQGRLRIAQIVNEIQVYLGLKFVISLATGVSVTVLAQLAALDFPVLLGLIAFVLNFVPTIGSIIAAIPGVVLALILHGEVTALVVALGYFGINTAIGNIVDPQIMGHRMGLSTLVVVLSLLFWGWLWGPIGALLSVPLTMVIKIALQNVPDLRWMAVLLDKIPPQAQEAANQAVEVLYTSPGTAEASVPVVPSDGPKRATG